MPYIKVKRDEHDSSGWTKFDCMLCDFHIPSGGCHNNRHIMRNHIDEKHSDELKQITDQKEKFVGEIELFRKTLEDRYPLAGRSIGHFFIPLSLPPRRMWKCDKCGDVMSPHDRYYHDSNAEKFCKPKGAGT